jgi:3-methyladenine DNA glycosylase AlkD
MKGMPPAARAIHREMMALRSPARAALLRRFFKTGPGEYGEGDVFLGLTVPEVRRLVRDRAPGATLKDAGALLASAFHEERLAALLLLVELFRRGGDRERERIYRFYLGHTKRINNWDLVDLSAPSIVGAWLAGRDRRILDRLARSKSLWERRIAVVATFHFIREGDLAPTLRLAAALLRDPHDLIHKAAGWMLREAGKRDLPALERFLSRHAGTMPRTMLRYAIERLPERRRRAWLAGSAPV